MRVFLVTNVLASAFGARGLCADQARSWETTVQSHLLYEFLVDPRKTFKYNNFTMPRQKGQRERVKET